jgi:para-aminobenzoate synthetase component 1
MKGQTPCARPCGPLTVFLQPLSAPPALGDVVRMVPRTVPLVWLDSARPHAVTGRWSVLGYEPWVALRSWGRRVEVTTSTATRVLRAHPLDVLRQTLERYRVTQPLPPPMHLVGLLGWFSYELNRWIEPRCVAGPQAAGSASGPPDLLWFGMRTLILVDHLHGRGWMARVADPHRPPSRACREALEALEREQERLAAAGRSHEEASHQDPASGGAADQRCAGVWPPSDGVAGAQPIVFESSSTPAQFEAMVARALDDIRAGDIFQANLAQQFTASWPWSAEETRTAALAIYLTLRRINPSPFACFLDAAEATVVSCSPERLVRAQDGRIETRPIAGTRPRGISAEEDVRLGLELLLNEKERAEHLMLVDLARNDLGRVAVVGSVRVDELMGLETYSHVHHIVSNVSGLLRRGLGAADIVRAVFPGGTITGCPKVRCMQIIRELEPVPRGLYSGSLGWLGFDGSLDLNIAIRTMVLREGRLSFHTGAGIVADSVPEREYHETLAKAEALFRAVRAAGWPAIRDGGSDAPTPSRLTGALQVVHETVC